MKRTTWWIAALTAALVIAPTAASAQPADDSGDPDAPAGPDDAAGDATGDADAGDGFRVPANPGAPAAGDAGEVPAPPPEATVTPAPAPAPAPQTRRAARRTFAAPEILTAPTGHLLPAGVIYSRSAIDTGGGLSSDLRVGLGDVAEFGVATTDLVRARADGAADPERLAPYVTATFRMGVPENRLFRGQPGLALGFRKSFEREQDGHSSRIAEVYLVASKHLGSAGVIHAGGVFWDASLASGDDPPDLLHKRGIKDQVRAFGGIELHPLDDADILVDLSWTPEFCYACTDRRIRLEPVLSWGVRYHVADWMRLESGVRVPDIADIDLLDAQIFGQITFVTWRLRNLVDGDR